MKQHTERKQAMHIKKAILAAVVMSATGLLAYNDDYITSSDDSVVKKRTDIAFVAGCCT